MRGRLLKEIQHNTVHRKLIFRRLCSNYSPIEVVDPRSKVTFVISRHELLAMHEFVQNMLNVAIPSERGLWLKGDRQRLEVRVPAS